MGCAEERKARAASKGLPVESVAAAEPLTVRVVNNVDKVQEVKAHFHEAFKADGFPGSLPFRQKVGMLRLERIQRLAQSVPGQLNACPLSLV